MALGLENPDHIILLDDMLARRTAQAAGLQVWGTLKILLEAKSQGLIDGIKPFVVRLSETGLWISPEIKYRFLALAKETDQYCVRHPLLHSCILSQKRGKLGDFGGLARQNHLTPHLIVKIHSCK